MVRYMPHKHGAMTSKAMHGGEFLNLRVTEVETGRSMRLIGQKTLPLSKGELQVNERPCFGGEVDSSPEG